MALAYRVQTVTYTDPVSGQDLSLNGNLLVVAEYIDDVAPTVVLHTEKFYVPSTETAIQIDERIKAFGRRARDARQRVTELQTFVVGVRPLN